jgi:hypothetical protein
MEFLGKKEFQSLPRAAAERRCVMRLWFRLLLIGTIALILTGLSPRPAHGQYWHRSPGYNPAYSFFWQNYWFNYGSPNYFPGARYWGYYPTYPGTYSWYAYNYPPGYVYYVPYYVAVPEPYPVVTSPKAHPTKTSSKTEVQKPAPGAKESNLGPSEPKRVLSKEEIKSQEERDAARQLRLAKVLLEAAEEEQQTGKEDDAQRLRTLARGHFVEIAQKYASTPAGKEAHQLLAQDEDQ